MISASMILPLIFLLLCIFLTVKSIRIYYQSRILKNPKQWIFEKIKSSLIACVIIFVSLSFAIGAGFIFIATLLFSIRYLFI